MRIAIDGNIGIGTPTPQERLAVNGKIRAKEIKVEIANWPDYVFDHDYKITPLSDLEKYIKCNGRLPDMPSAKEVERHGLELGETSKLLLKKMEELTLHIIELKKDNERLIEEARQQILKQEQQFQELRLNQTKNN